MVDTDGPTQGDGGRDFFAARADLEEFTRHTESGADDGREPSAGVPALRKLGRPPGWRAATSPESLLAPQYASAARRAREVLQRRSKPGGEQ